MCNRRGGFTLIELLSVVAIILILIAIALPNFLEAQIRARVTKASGDLRSIGHALEAYYLDFGYYPGESESSWAEQSFNEQGLKRITTPIPYISAIPQDPFPNQLEDNYDVGESRTYYGGGCWTNEPPAALARAGPIYAVWSRGPSQNPPAIRATVPNVNPYGGEIVSYSATNGTKSNGTIHHFAGEGVWWGFNTSPDSTSNLCTKEKLRPEFRNNPDNWPGLMVDKIVYRGTRPPNSYQ
jgi:type II secretion system protein G